MNYCAEFLFIEEFDLENESTWQYDLSVLMADRILNEKASLINVRSAKSIEISLNPEEDFPYAAFTLLKVYIDVLGFEITWTENMIREYMGHRLKTGRGAIVVVQPIDKDRRKTLIIMTMNPDENRYPHSN